MLGRLVRQRRNVVALAQFLGTEFNVQPRPGHVLVLRQATLQMGTESKTWRFIVVDADGATLGLLEQSFDAATGAPGASTDESVVLEDEEFILDEGQQIQIITAAATAAMRASLLFEEVPFG